MAVEAIARLPALCQSHQTPCYAGLRLGGCGDLHGCHTQAKEGAIEEGSQAWLTLSAGDRARRRQAAQDKAVKLRSPNFFVSRTRLSLRSLPRTVDEPALQKLLQDAVRARAVKAVPRLKQVRTCAAESHCLLHTHSHACTLRNDSVMCNRRCVQQSTI